MNQPLTPAMLEGIKAKCKEYASFKGELTCADLAKHLPELLAHIEAMDKKVAALKFNLSLITKAPSFDKAKELATSTLKTVE